MGAVALDRTGRRAAGGTLGLGGFGVSTRRAAVCAGGFHQFVQVLAIRGVSGMRAQPAVTGGVSFVEFVAGASAWRGCRFVDGVGGLA